ncbi:MAG: hypothetical protein JO272_16275 [Pseudonocardiales bacterium]|nr:hypothetical protein [Pseudonocardiales bacterium]
MAPTLPTQPLPQQRSWPAIPEICPPGEGMVWSLSAPLARASTVGRWLSATVAPGEQARMRMGAPVSPYLIF